MTHYIKFQYTRWDRWKRLTREFINKIFVFLGKSGSVIVFYTLFGLGWLGFFGADPKFFPDGGLIGRMKTRLKRLLK